MSLLKKAVVTVSALALAAPMVANGTAGIVSAAINPASNAKTETVAKPNSSLKVPLRNANSIFNLKLDKQKDGYVLETNIAASGNNVIQKGEQLVVHFSKDNVDLNNSSVVSQTSVPYTVKKDADKGTVTFTFNQDVDSGNYVSAVGIATKNLYTSTPVKANFEGAPIKIKDNLITSKWQAPQTTTTNGTNSSYSQSAYNTQSTTTSATTQSAMTQAASTQSSTTSYTTTYQQAGTETQTQADQSQAYTPTFDEAEQAVMNRTTINVVGDLPAASTDTTETSANKATTDGNDSTVATENNALPEKSTDGTATSTAANAVTTANATTDTATQSNSAATKATPATTNSANTSATTAQPAQATLAKQTASVQADASTQNVVRTPDGKASDPKATLNQVLADNGTDPNTADNKDENTSYQKNATFENIRKEVSTKAPTATADEQAQIVKELPWIWSYVANSASQDQVFNFSTLLSTGRTAYTTINGVADANSSNVLQQQMPQLLKSFGANIESDAFDKAMDIDVLLDSQVYQDYLDGKYTTTDNKLDANDAWKNMRDRITITKVDSNTDTSNATQLSDRTYNAKVTLDNLAQEAVEKKNAEDAQKLVVNSDVSENQATDQTEAQTAENATGSKLFSQMQKDIYGKMADASDTAKAEVFGSLPAVLNDVSKNTASSDKIGGISQFVQNTSDGNKYLISLDTSAITGSANKYLANMPQVFKAFGDSIKDGDFDKAIAIKVMEGSQVYSDYKAGKYVPDALVTKAQPAKGYDTSDLFGAIILAMFAIPAAALAMAAVTILTSPIWVPLAIATWGIVFAITALPIGFIYTVLGGLILPSLIVFPIMLVVSLIAAPILLVLNLVPIINLITIPISIFNLALTFIPGFIVLSFIPMLLLAAGIVIAGIALPIVMTIGLVIAQVIAGILSLLTGGLLAMLLPVTAIIGLIIAGAFSLLGLIGFALIAGLILGVVLGLIIAGFAVLTVVAGGFAGVIGLGLIAGLAVVLLGYLAFNFGGMLAGIAVFLILLVLMPQFLVLNFLLWFIGLGFMALILTDLAIPSLYLAIAIGGLMMLFFIPGLLIALSWPFWMGLVLQISIPIVEIALLIALPFSFIPLFGWIADAIVGVIILIQAIVLAVAIVAPIVIGVLMMTVGIIGFDIAAAAALVLELLKKKKEAKVLDVDVDTSWRLKIRPVGFWTKSDPLAVALA